MGFLDFLFDKDKAEERKYAKLQKTLTNMYVQPSERAYIIEQLRDLRTPEAVRVLLKRYGDSAPNTTVDLDEKERAYEVLVELGMEPDLDVVGIIREHLRTTEENVNWPMKVLSDLLDHDQFVELVCELLADESTDYQQNPEKKQELILRAQELHSDELAQQLVRFLEDSNETVRFLAVDALLVQDVPEVMVEPLARMLVDEESLRISQKVIEAFAAHQNWKVPADVREEVDEALPEIYGVHDQGHIYKHRR